MEGGKSKWGSLDSSRDIQDGAHNSCAKENIQGNYFIGSVFTQFTL